MGWGLFLGVQCGFFATMGLELVLDGSFLLASFPAEMVRVVTLAWRQRYAPFPARQTVNASLDHLVNITFMKTRSNFKNYLILSCSIQLFIYY